MINKTKLIYTSDADPGIRRKGAGTGFFYLDSAGEKVRNPDILHRIRALAIPPAYHDVWICPFENGHLQATGRDSRERKQYRYHPHWHEIQQERKFEGLLDLGAGLPRLRRRIRRELKDFRAGRDQVVASAVRLIDKFGFRVGNEVYLQKNNTRGISTLSKENVEFPDHANSIHLSYVAKGGRTVEAEFSDKILAPILEECHDLPGQRLFRYRVSRGEFETISSADINQFLSDSLGGDFTAKDLRTWRASVLVVDSLRKIAIPQDREREFRDAVKKAAKEIQNRYETCRSHYVHPEIERRYLQSSAYGFSRLHPGEIAELQIPEALLLSLLR